MENVQNKVVDINNITPEVFNAINATDLASTAHEIIGNSNAVFKYLEEVGKLDASYEQLAHQASSFMQNMAELAQHLLADEIPPKTLVSAIADELPKITFECIVHVSKLYYTVLYEVGAPAQIMQSCARVCENGISLLLEINKNK